MSALPSLKSFNPDTVPVETVRRLRRVYAETGSLARAAAAAGLTIANADVTLFYWLGVKM